MFDAPKAAYLARNGILVVAALGLTILGLQYHSAETIAFRLMSIGMALPFALLTLELPRIAEILSLRAASSDTRSGS